MRLHEKSLVRINAGAGILLRDGRILTCHHVLRDAQRVEITLPFLPQITSRHHGPIMADVVRCFDQCAPELRVADQPSDIAVLALPAPVRDTVTNKNWGIGPADTLWLPDWTGQSSTAYGFPSRYPNSTFAQVEALFEDASNWIEARSSGPSGMSLRGGFSGGPVITARAQGDVLIGMISAADTDERAGYIIPATQLWQAWPPLASPYQGLRAFDETSALWFHGRDEFIQKIIERLEREPVVAVIGASGSGKSSVVRAGVVRRLRREGWKIATCRPGDDPIGNLAHALVPILNPSLQAPAEIIALESQTKQKMRENPAGFAGDLHRMAKITGNFLVVVDQFEEIITRSPKSELAVFDQSLMHLAAAPRDTPLRLIITLRSDYADPVSQLDCGRRLLNEGQIRLTKMNRTELEQAITAPARTLGVSFESGREWELINQVAANDAMLPLAQYALKEVWLHQHEGRLTDQAFADLGGFDQVLGRKADEILAALDADGQAAAQRLFVNHLINVSKKGIDHDTKAQVRRGEVAADVWQAGLAFAAEGVWLLTVQQDAPIGAGQNSSDAVMEMTHEALIRSWPRLKDWLDGVREARVWDQEVRDEIARSQGAGDGVWSAEKCTRARRLRTQLDQPAEVAGFVDDMLGRSSAADIWENLKSPSARSMGLDQLARADEASRKATLRKLFDDKRCAEAYLARDMPIEFPLVGLCPSRAFDVADAINSVFVTTRQGDQRRLAAVLFGVRLGLALKPEQLVSALTATRDRGQYSALGTALAAVATRIDNPKALADQLLSALTATIDPGQCRALGTALAAVATRIDNPQALADQLLSALTATRDPDQRAALGTALAAVAPRIDKPQALTEPLLSALTATTDPGQCRALGTALAAVAARIDNPQALTDRLLSALTAPRGRGQYSALGTALGAVGARIDNPQALADQLLSALIATIDPDQCRVLGTALAAVAERGVTDAATDSNWFIETIGALRAPWTADSGLDEPLIAAAGTPAEAGIWPAIERLQARWPGANFAAPWPEPLLSA